MTRAASTRRTRSCAASGCAASSTGSWTRLAEGGDGAREARGGMRGEAARRQLDDERGGAAQQVVLPADGAAGVAREPSQREPAQAAEAPLDVGAPPGSVDEAERLVEPDRDAWTHALDQLYRRARLRLGGRARPAVLDIAAREEVPPAPREVAVEVDSAAVHARAGGVAVGVEVVYEPCVCAPLQECA